MDNTLLMQVVDRPGHGRDNPHGGVRIDRSLLDSLGEARAVDVLHGEEVLAVDRSACGGTVT